MYWVGVGMWRRNKAIPELKNHHWKCQYKSIRMKDATKWFGLVWYHAFSRVFLILCMALCVDTTDQLIRVVNVFREISSDRDGQVHMYWVGVGMWRRNKAIPELKNHHWKCQYKSIRMKDATKWFGLVWYHAFSRVFLILCMALCVDTTDQLIRVGSPHTQMCFLILCMALCVDTTDQLIRVGSPHTQITQHYTNM